MIRLKSWLTSSIVSRIAFGFPGKFRIRHLPLSPAVCLDKTAVGTYLEYIEHVRIAFLFETAQGISTVAGNRSQSQENTANELGRA